MSAPTVALDCRMLAWPGIGRYCRELAGALVEAAPDLRFYWLCNAGGEEALQTGPRASTIRLRTRPLNIGEQFDLPWALARQRIDQTGNDLVRRRFSGEDHAARLMDIYRDAIAGLARRAA